MKAIMRDEREMKDCGIQWLGNIPKHWNVGRVKQAFYSNKTIVGDNVDNYERLALTLNGVIKRSKEDNGGLQPEKFEGYQVLQTNELVFKLIDLENVATSRVGLSPYTGIVSPAYIVLHHRKEKCPRYAEYYFLSMWMHEIFNHLGGDGVRSNISTSALLKVPYLLIPSSEQEVIANYLDDRCSKIDAIIAEAKASIEEYKELKQAVIYEAVTKGLDKNVEMKDSGVEWVGTLPSHWNYRKLRYSINDIGDIDHYMPESVTNGIPYIMTGDLKNRVSEIDFDKCKHVSRNDYEKLSIKIKAEKGDIIFARYATIGALCYVDIDADFLVSYSCVIIKPNSKSIDSHFLEYYLQSSSFIEEAKRYANSNVQANIGKESMFQVKIALPSLDEQKKIVDFLDFKITCLDNLINEKQNLIEDLEAYKKSLIYEVVTGKRKVVA